MKISRVFISAFFSLFVFALHAQVDIQNTGTLYISGTSDTLYITGGLTNASGAALTNNGNVYVRQNLSNAQAAMTVGTGTLYLNGTVAQSVNGSQPFKTYNLLTGNAAGITLNNDLSVSGLHTFTAGVITGSATPNYLMYEAGSSYTGDGDSRHVNGWIRKTGSTDFVFPLGNGTVERTIAAVNLSVSGIFNATYGGATTNTGNVAMPMVLVDPNEYWTVNNLSGLTATINMNWNNSKIAMSSYNLTDIRVANYKAGNWTQVGGSASGNVTTTGTISSSPVTSFGAFTFGSVSFLLPLNLIQFNALRNNQHTVVSWTTSDEINVGYFDVQRSDDGIAFYSIGKTAARNLPGLQQYQLTDAQLLKETAWYRLVSTDLDGKKQFSKVVKVSSNGISEKYMTVVNPVRSSIYVLAGNITGDFEYNINTLAGQTLQQGRIKITDGRMTDIPLLFSAVKGVYVLQIQNTGYNFSKKIMIQ